jgi:hypothetical protein
VSPRLVPLRPSSTAVVRTVFVLSLVALLAVGLTGVGLRPGTHTAVLASSSSPFAASSPATTLATVPESPTSTTPTANTGQAWASPWFVGLIGLTTLLGLVCLWPTLARRREPFV